MKLVVKISAVYTCESWGSHSSVEEDSSLSGMYAMSQGNNLCFFGEGSASIFILALQMKVLGCYETSVAIYHLTQC